jgi:hypothetical protein
VCSRVLSRVVRHSCQQARLGMGESPAIDDAAGGVDHRDVIAADPVPADVVHLVVLSAESVVDSTVSRPCAGSSLFGPRSGMSLTPVAGRRAQVAVLKLAVVAARQRAIPRHDREAAAQPPAGPRSRYSPNEAAHSLLAALVFGALAAEVGPPVGVVSQLHNSGDVQGSGDLAVAGPGQPVPDLFSGGGIDRGCAGPGREVRGVREAGDVADSARIRAAPAGPIPGRSITILLTSTWLVVSARTGNAVSSKAHPSPATPRRGARPGHMP